MVTCVAFGCTNRSNKTCKGVTFHKFPKNSELLQKWILAVRRENWSPTPASVLCSVHFRPEDIDRTSLSCVRIRENAVPCIFSSYPPLPKKIRKCLTATRPKRRCAEVSKVGTDPDDENNADVDAVALEPDCVLKEKSSTRRTSKRKRGQAVKEVKRRRPLKNAQQSKPCVMKKNTTLLGVFKDLQQNNILSSDAIHVLQQMSSQNKEFLSLQLSNCLGTPPGKFYSSELRRFAMILHFSSPKAYKYVRKVFSTLPHLKRIRKWYEALNGQPGFTVESFNLLKNKASVVKTSPILCALSVAEIAIRQQVELHGTKLCGYVEIGPELDSDDSLPVAKEALTFMLIGINENWKLPLGYFLTSGVSVEQKANLIQHCLTLCHNAGVKVISVTFDGLSASFGIAVHSGTSVVQGPCSTSYLNSKTREELAVFIDPPYLMQLIRNAWRATKVIYDNNGEEINWSLIDNLHAMQEKEGLRFVNKLCSGHLKWHKQKTKFKLAAELLSDSVATAIEECSNLKLPGFEKATATVRFLRTLNGLFDIFSSRNLAQTGLKKPISPENYEAIHTFCTEAEQYLRSLKIHCDGFPVKLVDSRLKTGFMGLIVCVQSLFCIYDLYINPYPKSILPCLPMYKCSQDHYDLLFGCTNLMTARQFVTCYKRILSNNELKALKNGNCFTLDRMNVLAITSSKNLSSITRINLTSDRRLPLSARLDTSTVLQEPDYFVHNHPRTEYSVHITVYIADIVVQNLEKCLKCEVCLDALRGDEDHSAFYFLRRKSKGKGIFPSNDVVDVCQITEKLFHVNSYDQKCTESKRTILSLVINVLSHFQGRKMFEKLNSHGLDQSPLDNHSVLLIKAIAEQYLAIRV